MERSLDREYEERKLERELKVEVQKSIGRAKESMPFSSEEVKTLGSIYAEIARTKDPENFFDKMRSSESGLKKFELWKNFQGIIGENYNRNIGYQEFMSRVLH